VVKNGSVGDSVTGTVPSGSGQLAMSSISASCQKHRANATPKTTITSPKVQPVNDSARRTASLETGERSSWLASKSSIISSFLFLAIASPFPQQIQKARPHLRDTTGAERQQQIARLQLT